MIQHERSSRMSRMDGFSKRYSGKDTVRYLCLCTRHRIPFKTGSHAPGLCDHAKVLGNRCNSGEIRLKPMFERAKQHLRWSLAKSFPTEVVRTVCYMLQPNRGPENTFTNNETLHKPLLQLLLHSSTDRAVEQSGCVRIVTFGVVSGQACTGTGRNLPVKRVFGVFGIQHGPHTLPQSRFISILEGDPEHQARENSARPALGSV
jgi:hypothetical protein